MKMQKSRSYPKGLTIVELMVVTVVFTGISAALMVMFQTAHDSQLISSEVIYLQQEARRAFTTMSRELREAGNVRQAGDGVGQADFTDELQIDFQINRGYDEDDCGGTCWGDEDDNDRWVHYLLNTPEDQDTQLIRCTTENQDDAIDTDACRVMAHDVETFEADYDYAGMVLTLTLNIQKDSEQLRGGSVNASTVPLVMQVKLRNST